MSRSNPNEMSERPTNPSVRFIDWDSDNKQFKYYDKETKQNVPIKLPFSFLVLDTLATIKGWSNESDSGIWSNEIKNIKTDILTVMTKKGVEAKGTYEQIKGKVSGSKYCQSVYIAYPENKVWQIANIQMKGAALGSWIEFCSPDKKSGNKRPDLLNGAVQVKSTEEGKVGKIVFNKPVFTYIETVPAEVQEKALVLDKELQEYLVKYFAYIKSMEGSKSETTESAVKPNIEFTVPPTRSNVKIEETVSDVVPDDFNDMPF